MLRLRGRAKYRSPPRMRLCPPGVDHGGEGRPGPSTCADVYTPSSLRICNQRVLSHSVPCVCDNGRMSKRIHVVLSDPVLKRVDELRGLVPRSAWINRALEGYLANPALLGDPSLPAGSEERWRSSHAFEVEREAVRAAVESGAKSVRVEAGSSRKPPPPRDTWAR